MSSPLDDHGGRSGRQEKLASLPNGHFGVITSMGAVLMRDKEWHGGTNDFTTGLRLFFHDDMQTAAVPATTVLYTSHDM